MSCNRTVLYNAEYVFVNKFLQCFIIIILKDSFFFFFSRASFYFDIFQELIILSLNFLLSFYSCSFTKFESKLT